MNVCVTFVQIRRYLGYDGFTVGSKEHLDMIAQHVANWQRSLPARIGYERNIGVRAASHPFHTHTLQTQSTRTRTRTLTHPLLIQNHIKSHVMLLCTV
jgi:hypothetical protein